MAEIEENNSGITEKINSFINNLKKRIDLPQRIDWGAYDIANQAFDAMQSTIARQKLAAYPPDRIIEIPRNVCTIFEFDRADELIELGYRRAEAVMGASADQ